MLVAAFSKVAGAILPSPSWPAALNQGGRWADQGDAADDDGALWRNTSRYFDSHDAAQRETDEDEGFGRIDLGDQPGGVCAEGFFLLRWDPMDMGCLVAFRQSDVGEHAVIGADAGDEICCHESDFLPDGDQRLVPNLRKKGVGRMGIRKGCASGMGPRLD